MSKRRGSVLRRRSSKHPNKKRRSNSDCIVYSIILLFIIQILLFLPSPLTEVASANFSNAPTVYNYYVTPQTGYDYTIFTYYATYKDADNQNPSVMMVEIDGKNQYNMSYVNGTALAGMIYKYSTKLSQGIHNFTIIYNDGNGSTNYRTNVTSWPYVQWSTSNTTSLSNGTVTPTKGNNTLTYTYKVTYSNSLGNPGTNVYVVLQGDPMKMSYVSGSNTTGAIYEYKTKLGAGSHNYYFIVGALNNTITRLPSSGSYSGPDVSYTGWKGPFFYSGGVTPHIGHLKTIFNYTIVYQHCYYNNGTPVGNGSAPTSSLVVIDGKSYTMKPVSKNYCSGVQFYYSTNLSAGDHKFYFLFNNGTFRDPLLNNQTPNSSFYKGPYVVDGLIFLHYNEVYPSTGYPYTTFTYSVKYYNGNNTAPTSAQVYIDGQPYNMSHVTGNYSNGVKFTYSTKLSGGDHTYYFLFKVGNTTVRLPKSGGTVDYFKGPSVINDVLSIFNGKVTPSSGYPTTNFNYTVRYWGGEPINFGNGNDDDGDGTSDEEYYNDYDDDGDFYTDEDCYNMHSKGTGKAPTSALVYIDGTPYSMKHVPGNYSAGITFWYNTKLNVGHHKYYFTFKLGNESKTIPERLIDNKSYYAGPDVAASTAYLSKGQVTPTSGYLYTLFNYTVTYVESNNTAPKSAKVYIDGKAYSMRTSSSYFVNGATYWYTTNLTGGSHNYYFEFIVYNQSSGNKTLRWPAQGNASGPYVNTSFIKVFKAEVQPSQGNITTTFTYTLQYNLSTSSGPNQTQSDCHYSNLTLSNVKVVIDGISNNMTYVSGNNQTAAHYEHKTTLSIGSHNYYFTADVGTYKVRLPATGTYQGPKVINEAPRLYTGTVSPQVGYANSTVFNFTVNYSDLEGKSPYFGNVFVNGSYHNMTYVSGSYKTGAKYIYKTTLLPGNYQYHFHFSDGTNTVRLPKTGNFNGPVVTEKGKPINYPPELYNGSVSPSSGTNKTDFTYVVYYKDKNNDPPSVTRVFIDDDAYNMTAKSGDYLNGKRYEYTTKLTVGTHNYYFYFKDINNSVGRLPSYGYYTGPNVLPPPNKPPELSNGTVSPASGNTSTKFTYKIFYKDPEGDKPTIKRVYIDGSPFTMTPASTGLHSNGVVYQYSTYLNAGNHTYYFFFNDSKNSVRFPKTGVLSGPRVTSIPQQNNTAPKLYYGRVYPTSGTPKTNFTYYVYYYDADGDKPTISDVNIDGTFYKMKSYYSQNYTSSNWYGYFSYSTRLPVGNHTYYFLFSDGYTKVRLPASGIYSGPVVTNVTPNKPPVLWNGKVLPLKGDTNTEFVYTVSYKDPEGKAPTTKVVYIDGSPKVMTYKNGSYSTNAIFEYKTKLSVGTHYFYFLFSDGANTARLPKYTYYYGPVVVKPNKPPVAEAGPDQKYTVGPPKTVYFDGSNSSDPDGDKLTYFWNFGDGGYAYGVKASHVFHGVGTYNVKLTVSDGRLKDTDNCSVKITDSGQGKSKGKAPEKAPKIDTNKLALSLAATTLIAGGVAGIVILGTEWGLYGLLVLFLPLYVRLSKSKVLNNFNRGKIYGFILAKPGVHYNFIKDSLQIKNGALAHHLRTLEREHLIKSQADGKYKRFYPYEMDIPENSRKYVSMRRNIMEQIKDEPGITQNKISEKIGTSHQVISYHLRTLALLGAVIVEKDGRVNHCYPGDYEGVI